MGLFYVCNFLRYLFVLENVCNDGEASDAAWHELWAGDPVFLIKLHVVNVELFQL